VLVCGSGDVFTDTVNTRRRVHRRRSPHHLHDLRYAAGFRLPRSEQYNKEQFVGFDAHGEGEA